MAYTFSTLLQTFNTSEGEAIEIRYIPSRMKLEVIILYDDLTLTQYPVLHKDGSVVYDFPERISNATRFECQHIMRTMRYVANG